MAAFKPPPKSGSTIKSLAEALTQLHTCLHQVAQAVDDLKLQANERENNRQERHHDMTQRLDSLTQWVKKIDLRQNRLAAQFGVTDDAARRHPRLLGISRGTLLSILGALIVGFCTGPVGYYLWLKVLPAAIHGALTVAP